MTITDGRRVVHNLGPRGVQAFGSIRAASWSGFVEGEFHSKHANPPGPRLTAAQQVPDYKDGYLHKPAKIG